MSAPTRLDAPTLKPCPFCGESLHRVTGGGMSFWTVQCHGERDGRWVGCGATVGLRKSEADAIAAWNRRAPDAALQALAADAERLDELEAWTRDFKAPRFMIFGDFVQLDFYLGARAAGTSIRAAIDAARDAAARPAEETAP